MTVGRSEREPRAGSKVEIVRTALAVVRLARRASRLRLPDGDAGPASTRTDPRSRARAARRRG